MTRPRKQTVDYFPHSSYVDSGKTIPSLISKFGEKGYIFFFRLLELLAKTEGHGYDCNDELNWVHLQSYTFVNDEFLTSEILDYMVKLQAIDGGAWTLRGIWCQNFVDGIRDAYRNRAEEIPTLEGFLRKLSPREGIPDVVNPQSKVKRSKVEESKIFVEDSDESRLSQLLYQRMKENNPNAKEPNIQSWAKHIDLMIRIDKRAPSEIETVIGWCQKDNFWHSNILSTAKLREKYDQLCMRMKEGGTNGTSQKRFPADSRSASERAMSTRQYTRR